MNVGASVPDELEAALAVAQAAADEAGAVALTGLGHAREVRHKRGPSDLVTEFDLACERAIVGRLVAAFPADAVVAEEDGGRAGARRTWYVDPIDGTTNFAHGLPWFCISIGLHDEQGAAVGVIDAPALGLRFHAARGRGAWLAERQLARAPRRLEVSGVERLDAALLATGFPYDLRVSDEDNMREFAALQRAGQAVRRAGSAALDLAAVAAAWFDGYWEQKLNPWDVAAGVLLVEEAGGRVTGYDGKPMTLASGGGEGGKVVASNGRVHDQLLAALAEARRG